MTNRLSNYWSHIDSAGDEAERELPNSAPSVAGGETQPASELSTEDDPLAQEWLEYQTIRLLDAIGHGEVPASEPQTVSFAEWAPRVRAEREASRRCPCRTVGQPCSVCREQH